MIILVCKSDCVLPRIQERTFQTRLTGPHSRTCCMLVRIHRHTPGTRRLVASPGAAAKRLRRVARLLRNISFKGSGD